MECELANIFYDNDLDDKYTMISVDVRPRPTAARSEFAPWWSLCCNGRNSTPAGQYCTGDTRAWRRQEQCTTAALRPIRVRPRSAPLRLRTVNTLSDCEVRGRELNSLPTASPTVQLLGQVYVQQLRMGGLRARERAGLPPALGVDVYGQLTTLRRRWRRPFATGSFLPGAAARRDVGADGAEHQSAPGPTAHRPVYRCSTPTHP
jgi:hypothetical protein